MPKGDSKGSQHGDAVRRGKYLTELLHKELAKIDEELTENGEAQTKAEAIIASIVRDARGWTERTRDDNGNLVEIKHPAQTWAKEFVVDRIEGRPGAASPEVGQGIKAADKVRDAAKSRLTAMGKGKSVPPAHTPKT